MKKITTLLLTFVICLLLSSCTPLYNVFAISYNDDYSEMYYNGYTYIDYNNTHGKYRFANGDLMYSTEEVSEYWVGIAMQPYGFFYVLGAVTEYYGNDKKCPDFIINSRTIDFYVREDITLNHDSELSICDIENPYYFKISDITTSNSIPYSFDSDVKFTDVCNFYVSFKEYPGVKLWLEVYEYEGKLYLQDVWDSDYYEITDSFKEDIYRLGLDTFDYH